MAIASIEVKKLWGLAAGRCSAPGCTVECVKFLADADPTVIGEMAHVIASSPRGPRGGRGRGSDKYDNLILLCPTHHRTIDKAPVKTYPPDLLREWKRLHEDTVRQSLGADSPLGRSDLFGIIRRLLNENREIWVTYGPESTTAKMNPLSNLAEVWKLRKVIAIVPNNRRIVNLLRANGDLLTPAEYEVACTFIEHAEGFEQSCYRRRENVPRFPLEFEAMIHGRKKKK